MLTQSFGCFIQQKNQISCLPDSSKILSAGWTGLGLLVADVAQLGDKNKLKKTGLIEIFTRFLAIFLTKLPCHPPQWGS